jgi:hypothetical protein
VGAAAVPGRLARLFKVLVVGGAVLAVAYASAISGGTGSGHPGQSEPEDGGPKGW